MAAIYEKGLYAKYVKVAPGKPQTGRVKLKISQGTGEVRFSLGEGKQSAGSVTEGWFQSNARSMMQRQGETVCTLL